MTSPKLDELEGLLSRLELLAGRDGWGQPPSFWLLYDRAVADTEAMVQAAFGNRRTVRLGRLGSYMALRLVSLIGPSASLDAIRTLANNLALGPDEPESQMLMAGLRTPGFLGLALAAEVSSLKGAPRAVAVAAAKGEAKIEDQPAAVTSRIVWAVDCDDRVHVAERVQCEAWPTVKTDVKAAGHCVTSLRIMVDAVMGRTPADQDAWDARYPVLATMNP